MSFNDLALSYFESLFPEGQVHIILHFYSFHKIMFEINFVCGPKYQLVSVLSCGLFSISVWWDIS
jgi:hypothetical protein